MSIRDKILKIKSERENRVVHLEKQKTPEQKKQEIKNKISQFTHAIKMLEARRKRAKSQNRPRFNTEINNKKKQIKQLQTRLTYL